MASRGNTTTSKQKKWIVLTQHGSHAWTQSQRWSPKRPWVWTISTVVSMKHRTWPKYNCRGNREGKMRADVQPPTPPREGSRCASLTLVRMRVLRTPHQDHLPQVLPTSLWPKPPSSPTYRWGRGTSLDTSLLCPSLILKPRWARTRVGYCLGFFRYQC